jgi:hypothetical protein
MKRASHSKLARDAKLKQKAKVLVLNASLAELIKL